ncbi:MAG: xanthine dehydrogenase family protein subunit M [Rhodospirillaceae bacterium]|jgi:aerobic carbon-monoxide dehydrogenase medium subunit|nr:xanthine dehydrogenase family protein subunit M [Rhodospirillaceae bacterium]MBT5941823.1 xanthine dehydrogenase family protein subunit M [Rhodospirillaceae bacterium]MBT7268755.1 xanthine dehydrogenase family protein subunit M [Rhodospirillaceae bacterium]
MYDFEYQRATSVEDATAKYGAAEDARFLAGGMTLVPVLKQRLDQPSDVVDLGDLDDMRGISEEGGAIVIKAMTTHHDVNTSDLVNNKIPALAALAGTIGDQMVRNRGTIGGSLANNDPAASYPSAVLALNATIKTNAREISADDFFTGMFDTALDEGELILAVSFPIPEESGYKHFPNPASRFPIVGSFVAKSSDGVRVAITGAGPCAFRVTEFEDALSGGFDPDAIRDIKVSDDGLNTDIHASAEYRAHLINVMTRRAMGE